MAATIVVTRTSPAQQIEKVSIAWTSHTDGSVSALTFPVQASELLQVRYIPGATTPSAAYDATILDANSIDVLGGTGANLSETASTVHVPVVSTYFRRILEAGNLTMGITNAGSGKTGTIELLLRYFN